MVEEEVVAVGADNESSMCKAGFASDEELFIDPIICVVPVPEMAPLRDFSKSAPSGYPLPAPQEDELLTWQRSVSRDWDFPGRRQKPRLENRTGRRCGCVRSMRKCELGEPCQTA